MDYKRKERLESERVLKDFAHSEVTKAIARGDLKREPCLCGETKVHAHHGDYTKPLDVVWLCQKHHREIHNIRNRAEHREYLERID